MARVIDLYWDLGSTNTYFAIKLLQPIVARHNAEIRWHAFNVGHVFQANNYVLMDEPKAKLKNRKDDLMRWARKYQLPFSVPKAFPIKTSRAAYWEQGDGSIGDYSRLRQIAASLDVDPDEFEAAAESESVRAELIDSTNRALQRGVFGVPSIGIENDIYWGKDRMEFVEDHLARL
jgi:2-hydroxychromene-2-carboxylate isomerase